jgi:hypothetical protein
MTLFIIAVSILGLALIISLIASWMWICKVSDEREEKIREFEERNK